MNWRGVEQTLDRGVYKATMVDVLETSAYTGRIRPAQKGGTHFGITHLLIIYLNKPHFSILAGFYRHISIIFVHI